MIPACKEIEHGSLLSLVEGVIAREEKRHAHDDGHSCKEPHEEKKPGQAPFGAAKLGNITGICAAVSEPWVVSERPKGCQGCCGNGVPELESRNVGLHGEGGGREVGEAGRKGNWAVGRSRSAHNGRSGRGVMQEKTAHCQAGWDA